MKKMITVSEYNDMQNILYNNVVKEWENDPEDLSIHPQKMFFGMRKNNGELITRGYVLTDKNRAVYGETQKEACAAW